MKKLLFFFFLYLAYICYSQVGIGTSTPRGALDINNPTTNTYGLVLPTNTSTSNIVNPRGGAIAPATMIFETNNDCIKFFRQTTWSNCLLIEDGSLFSVSKVEQASTFNGTYRSNTAMTTSNTYVVGIKNESPTSVSISLSTLDLQLSGVNGLSVGSVSPTTLTILPGATGLATYTITGTPTSCGILTGTWQKIKLAHTADLTVHPNYICDEGTWNNTVSPAYKLDGLITGESYSGTYTIPYNEDRDCPLPSETITQDGLTLTYEVESAILGKITYTLSGTYTGENNGAVTFVTAGGCRIFLGPCRSCKEILELFPGSPDGVYRIDPDQEIATYPVMNAQCDMTTDGGGWTMVLNYLHLGGISSANVFRNDLPLIGSSTLGENEGGDPITWGHANKALQLALAPSQYRFYGITSGHSRVIHFKTIHYGSVSYFTGGATGSVSGIQSSFTALAGHTANLPAQATNFYVGGANSELIAAPFYRAGVYNWVAETNRWEVDDYPNNNSRSTLHRVWVK